MLDFTLFIVTSKYSHVNLKIILDFEMKKWSIWGRMMSERKLMIDFYKY